MAKIHRYEGDQLTVSYDLHRCIHAAECVRGLPAVFDPDARPWVDPDAADADRILAVVNRCPTGALKVAERKDGGALEGTPAENVVVLATDGPLYAEGDLVVLASSGETLLEDTRIAFCRCGQSQRKPFCDGRHSKSGFSDPGALEDVKVREGEAGDPRLTVRLTDDGPLILEGPVTIKSADGETAAGSRAALCRCGASANKPFCDGSHAGIGFQSD